MHWCLTIVCACLVGIAAANVVKMEMEMKGGFDRIKEWNPEVRHRTNRNFSKQKVVSKSRLGAFRWEKCNHTSTDVFDLKTLEISPDPLKIPGDIYLSFSAVLGVRVNSHLKTNVEIKKKVFGIWFRVPCVDNLGSCNYNDTCESLSNITSCPTQFKDHDIPCHCPLDTGTYVLPRTKFTIDMPPITPLSGDYKILINSTFDGEPIACYKIDFALS